MDKEKMVETLFIQKTLNQLEKYLIRKNGFSLLGESYDLILLVPSDKYVSDSRYSLIISAKKFDNLRKKEVISELLHNFKEFLEFDEYNSISRINIVHSEDPFVKNLKFLYLFRDEVIEVNNVLVGGVDIDFGYLIKSFLLEKLVENHRVVLEIAGRMGITTRIETIVRRIDHNYDVIFYTQKGLDAIGSTDIIGNLNGNVEAVQQKSESFLFQNNLISKAKFDDILHVF